MPRISFVILMAILATACSTTAVEKDALDDDVTEMIMEGGFESVSVIPRVRVVTGNDDFETWGLTNRLLVARHRGQLYLLDYGKDCPQLDENSLQRAYRSSDRRATAGIRRGDTWYGCRVKKIYEVPDNAEATLLALYELDRADKTLPL